MEALASSSCSIGSALAAHWSGLKKQVGGKASAPANAGARPQVSSASKVVRMTIAVEKKAYVTTKSEEIFTAAKVGGFSSLPLQA